MSSIRRRRKHKFELNVVKEDELQLHRHLNTLRKSRQYLPTIRDALTLLFSLQEGNIELLEAMFPDLIEVLHREGAEQERARYHEEHNHKLATLEAIISSLDRPGQLPQVAGPKPLGAGVSSLPGGPKTLNAPDLAAPTFDDDDDEILTVKRDTSTHSARNFIEATLGLQQ